MNSRERVQRALDHTTADMIPYWADFTSIESQMRFFREKFFEADPFTQSLYRAKFMNSDIITLPIVGFPGCYDIFCQKLYEGEDCILSKTPFNGIRYWHKRLYFAKILHVPSKVQLNCDARDTPLQNVRRVL